MQHIKHLAEKQRSFFCDARRGLSNSSVVSQAQSDSTEEQL